MFYPFLNYFNRGRVRTVDNFGIPVLRTNYVTTDTTTTSVTYGICPKLWRQLPCQGLFILHVTSTPASAATPTDLVFLDPTSFTNRQIDNTTTVITSTGAKALLNGSGAQMTNKQRKEAIAKCDEEMAKCQALLDKLGINDKPAKENDEIIALQKEVNELKNIIRKANQIVPPPMKEMLPQDMKNAMDKVGQ